MKKFIKKIIYKYIKPWFFSSDDPQRIKVPYVISLVFLSLTVVAIISHLSIKMWQFRQIVALWQDGGVESIKNIKVLAALDLSLVPLITVLVGSAGLFIGLYNWGKKKNPSPIKGTYKGTGEDDGHFDSGEV